MSPKAATKPFQRLKRAFTGGPLTPKSAGEGTALAKTRSAPDHQTPGCSFCALCVAQQVTGEKYDGTITPTDTSGPHSLPVLVCGKRSAAEVHPAQSGVRKDSVMDGNLLHPGAAAGTKRKQKQKAREVQAVIQDTANRNGLEPPNYELEELIGKGSFGMVFKRYVLSARSDVRSAKARSGFGARRCSCAGPTLKAITPRASSHGQ